MANVSINIVVLNGEKYIRHCLESVLAQSYPHELVEINILDNGSTDSTINIIEKCRKDLSKGDKLKTENFKITFIKSNFNHGMWGGQEELLKHTQSQYVVFLSVDVIMDKDFIGNAIRVMSANPKLGGLQAKVYQFRADNFKLDKKIIDTIGFKVFRSRRVVNIGHGEEDNGPAYAKACATAEAIGGTRSAGKQFDFNKPQEIFGVEGAVPVFRKEALESIRVSGEIADYDLFWYAEDLDVAWRLRMAGWEQYYEPSVIAWHDRQTTKRTHRGLWDFIAIRRAIPLQKRRLEWRNIRCTIIKNDYIINILRDWIYLLSREIMMTIYLLVFEPAVLGELPSLLKLIPRMIRKRKEIMKRARVSPYEIHTRFS